MYLTVVICLINFKFKCSENDLEMFIVLSFFPFLVALEIFSFFSLWSIFVLSGNDIPVQVVQIFFHVQIGNASLGLLLLAFIIILIPSFSKLIDFCSVNFSYSLYSPSTPCVYLSHQICLFPCVILNFPRP